MPVLKTDLHVLTLKAPITTGAEDKGALAIRRIFSLVDMITKAKFSNSLNDFKICLFG